jgi:hypothetical protein
MRRQHERLGRCQSGNDKDRKAGAGKEAFLNARPGAHRYALTKGPGDFKYCDLIASAER